MIPLLLLACSPHSDPAPPTEPIFVRGGLVVAGAADEARALPGGRALVSLAWKPGEPVAWADTTLQAPRMAECVPLFHTDLGDVSRLVAMGGEAPDTALAWSPDGSRLAAGAYTGELVVVDGWTGQEIARKKLAEGMVKHVAWSPDGQTLYAGEQSPDAYLWALDPASLESRWSLRLADEVGSSTPPPGQDLYGVYTLPAAYGLSVLPSGELLVSAAHGWGEGAARQNRARLLVLGPDGRVRRAWPEKAADAIFLEPRLDPAGRLLIMPINRSAAGPAPAELPVGGAVVLRVADLAPVTSMIPKPLPPWYSTAFIWDALDVDPDAGTAMVGLGDGRVQLWPLAGGDPRELTPGTPILAGAVPVAASVGFGLLRQGTALYLTAGTNIPYGAAAPDLRPPSTHPGENTLWANALDGGLRWTWRGEQRLNGLSVGPDGRTLVVGAGPRVSDERRDLYGALIFDLGGPERSGDERLEAFCGTEGPVFFRQALTSDGRVAVTEVPTLGPDGAILGRYQVTVLR